METVRRNSRFMISYWNFCKSRREDEPETDLYYNWVLIRHGERKKRCYRDYPYVPSSRDFELFFNRYRGTVTSHRYFSCEIKVSKLRRAQHIVHYFCHDPMINSLKKLSLLSLSSYYLGESAHVVAEKLPIDLAFLFYFYRDIIINNPATWCKFIYTKV